MIFFLAPLDAGRGQGWKESLSSTFTILHKMYFALLPITNRESRSAIHVLLAALVSLALASPSLYAQPSSGRDVLRLRLSTSLASLDRLVKAEPQAAVPERSANCVVLDPELQGRYFGGCKDGLAEGYGQAIGTAEYKGGFKAGRKNGKGTKTWPSGDRYEGDFVDDRKQGKGTYTWGPRSAWAGEKYSGSYVGDRRQGFGVYEWPGGDRYAGPWKNDVITGPMTPKMMARTRAYAELAAAVGKRGAEVCRNMIVGSVTDDWVRGTVTEVQGERIAVRIDDPGRFPHVISDRAISKGDTVWDELQFWTPCK